MLIVDTPNDTMVQCDEVLIHSSPCQIQVQEKVQEKERVSLINLLMLKSVKDFQIFSKIVNICYKEGEKNHKIFVLYPMFFFCPIYIGDGFPFLNFHVYGSYLFMFW